MDKWVSTILNQPKLRRTAYNWTEAQQLSEQEIREETILKDKVRRWLERPTSSAWDLSTEAASVGIRTNKERFSFTITYVAEQYLFRAAKNVVSDRFAPGLGPRFAHSTRREQSEADSEAETSSTVVSSQ
jgi:hypothetical protein